MHMLRHYFVSDNLDELEQFEEHLEAAGIATPQIHVLSSDDAEVQRHAHLESAAGWTPFIFLAVVLLGFLTWEGGLIGIQEPNHNFTRFEQALKEGKHVFFVDLEPGQESILETTLKRHEQLVEAGTGTSTPHWLISLSLKSAAVRQAF